MKRKMYPHSFIYILGIVSCLTIISLLIFCIAWYWKKIDTSDDLTGMISITVILFPLIPVFIIGLIDMLLSKLVFTEEGLLIKGPKLKGKIQHEEYIPYNKIVDIKIVCSHLDSRGRVPRRTGIAAMRPHIYFEFILTENVSKFLHIEIYSTNQRKKILEIINQMTNLDFSYSKLEKVDRSMFRRKKK